MSDHIKSSFEHQNLSTSPIGSRSPQVSASNIPRQDSSGTLKTTIILGRNPVIVPKGPFYLCKDLPEPSEVNGSMNLITYHGLQTAYAKYCGKKMKEDLSSTLSLPGNINLTGTDDNSSLRSLVEKPPITGKELHLLTTSQLTGFRLHPGQIPEQHRLFAPQKRKSKKRTRQELDAKQPVQHHTSTEEVVPEQSKKPKKPKEKKPKKEKKKKRQKKDGD